MADRDDLPAATPRFSFLMITYNQEQYVADALNSALAQDYPDLEIIVSDDCSSDRTFAIVSDIAKNYHGPHKIVLHRNEPNLGIGGNFDKAYTLSSGEWLFMAAGDDISLPNRCRIVADAIQAHPAALAIASNYEIIDDTGELLGYNIFPSPLRPGAAMAWQRRVFAEFPPLSRDNKLEDFPLYTRVFFLGGEYVCVSDVLLKYRIDGHSYTGAQRTTAAGVALFRLKNTSTCHRCVQQRLDDLHYARERWAVPYAEQFEKRFQWLQKYLAVEITALAETLRVLQSPLRNRLRYLFTPTTLVWHESYRFRLRIFLSSCKLLTSLKRAICGQPAVTVIDTINHQPNAGAYEYVRVEDYLNKLICDYAGTAFPECFNDADNGWLQRLAISQKYSSPTTIRRRRVGQLIIHEKDRR